MTGFYESAGDPNYVYTPIAKEEADRAEQEADRAQAAADSVSGLEVDLNAAVVSASGSADAAALSASEAAASELASGDSETAAAQAASDASTSASESAVSAGQALSSASSAASSASSASSSAGSASASKTAAETAESNAASSASNAAVSETNAATSAQEAADSAASITETPMVASASRNQVMNQDPLSQGVTPDTLTIEQDTLISFASGYDATGEVNSQENVGAGTTLALGSGFEDKQLYVYKDKDGSYGTTEHRPLEVQDYSGVQTPNQDDVNLRTTAKHFDYESSTGVASASSEGNPVWGAFTGNDIVGVSGERWSANGTSGWVQYKYNEPRVLKSWRMREDVNANRLPRLFTIEGSNDGLVWLPVDSTYTSTSYVGSGISLWGDLQDSSSNTEAYLYHRINITANDGDASFIAIGKLEFNTVLPSDRYDVEEGVMYNSAGTPINRVYLGELRTDTNGDIINNTIVNYTPAKRKVVDEEVHGDLTVRGEILNSTAVTSWATFDCTQNPPLLLDGKGITGLIDLGTGQFEAVHESPLALGYGTWSSHSAASNTGFSSTYAQEVSGFKVLCFSSNSTPALQDPNYLTVAVIGGKS